MSMKFKETEFKGVKLTEKDFKEKKIIFHESKCGAYYAWSAGVAISKFLNELKAGRLVARRCDKCGRVLIPPRMFCELCYRPTDEWVYVKDTGKVNTFSITHRGVDGITRLKNL